jgi:NAD(P)H-dependent FMN reductase
MHEHTKRWSAIVSRADAFVFVTPEYNYGSPPSLVNALDYLLREWATSQWVSSATEEFRAALDLCR